MLCQQMRQLVSIVRQQQESMSHQEGSLKRQISDLAKSLNQAVDSRNVSGSGVEGLPDGASIPDARAAKVQVNLLLLRACEASDHVLLYIRCCHATMVLL
jgi:hypothetical protein